MQLVCPAHTLSMVKTAIDNGADCVNLRFRDTAYSRHPGLNLDDDIMEAAVRYAHDNGGKLFLTLNGEAKPSHWEYWRDTIDYIVQSEVDAIALADPQLMLYIATHYPGLPLHLSMRCPIDHQAIHACQRHFGVTRIVLPRLHSLSEVENILTNMQVEIGVFTAGTPDENIWLQDSSALAIDVPASPDAERRQAKQQHDAVISNLPIDALHHLPQLMKLGVHAIKIDARQRSLANLGQMTKSWRITLDRYEEKLFCSRGKSMQQGTAYQSLASTGW